MTKGASSVLVKTEYNTWTCCTPIKLKNYNNSINNDSSHNYKKQLDLLPSAKAATSQIK